MIDRKIEQLLDVARVLLKCQVEYNERHNKLVIITDISKITAMIEPKEEENNAK